MSTQPTVPPTQPGSASLADQLPTIIAQIQASKMGTTSADAPIVPLWKVRPATPRPGSTAAAERAMEDVGHGAAGSTALADRRLSETGTYSPTVDAKTQSYAEAYWLDMSPEDRKAFADSARKAGLWKPTSGAEGLANAWSKSVASAAQYNSSHGKDEWISPFEAVTKLAIPSLAGEQGSYNGFTTRTLTSVHQYTMDELFGQARQILQQELGRDPSQKELKAFTLAVNKASAANPVTTVEQSQDTGIDPVTGQPTGQNVQRVSTGGGSQSAFDPSQTITDMVQGSQEHADYQAAAVYFPAVMQALGAVV